ncbi:MAG: 3-hydroxy-3-methylglutaryl-CoA reductase [Gemmatimonadales bacterium]|nr:3-hydroxy-3-methylglutaryl-CoA reductase [Gemmatimonadales bacterium]NIN11175.1 3-hydroxy-3-methylglutaryl-CoA reductase [Gemmatimonadales bacterium]NIN49774.1 3-hydroxy-3-methylglutaryl-CoA reductase [Gemmatimonadales bacterium]NIP07238.1 3-hydroxy-3-methylglutaryl-CoA reductase [Gemmatimonadales bacterium]NIR00451.1 3-hydroxy-3-methylglutaryl-CoA reductase [Gemmatimonadales bacterium]
MARTSPNSIGRRNWTEAARQERLEALRRSRRVSLPNLALRLEDAEALRGQIENFVGVVRVPVGVAGPLAVLGDSARGTFHVPLATTEGTLVLAVSRGAEAITAAGGATVEASEPEVSRAPLFAFPSGAAAQAAVAWTLTHVEQLRVAVATQTRHGRLLRVEPVRMGRRLVLRFVYDTEDAAGQNMVTLATAAACDWLRRQAPFARVEAFSIETNASRDKKIAALATAERRGRRVDADVTIPRAVVARSFRTTPDALARVAREGAYASIVSGAIGAQAQFANTMSALFVATGQDVATVAESGTGLTIMEATGTGDLYASITIPNLVVGTVGGGTRLPSQRECLTILGCAGSGHGKKFAEIVGATVLAGELALVASLATNTFAQAHATFGRPPRPTSPEETPR